MNIRDKAIKAHREAEHAVKKINSTLTGGNLMQIKDALQQTLEAVRLQAEWLDAVETP